MEMEREVIYTPQTENYIHDLMFVFFEKGYLYFFDDAEKYVNKLLDYAEKYAGILPDKEAPVYFNRYGKNMKYITYQANKATTWYIFYRQNENIFLISYITNNHFEGQYFNV
jgi:hypothetical protein